MPEQEGPLATGVSALKALAVLLLVVALAVASLVLLILGSTRVVVPLARGDPWATIGIFLAISALAGGGAYALRDVSERRVRPVFTGLCTVAVVSVLGALVADDERRDMNEVVADYCAYGSVSQSQLLSCRSRVDFEYIERARTPARVFAFGGAEAECGSDSGPFCEDVLRRRISEELDDR